MIAKRIEQSEITGVQLQKDLSEVQEFVSAGTRGG
jgi:hypothetical protein